MYFLTLAEILKPYVGYNCTVGAFDTLSRDITQAIVDAAVAEPSKYL